MSTKRPPPSAKITASSQPKRIKGHKFIDPITVLAALEEPGQTPAEALEWVKRILKTAIDMQPQSLLPPVKKQKQKVSHLLPNGSSKSNHGAVGLGALELDNRYDRCPQSFRRLLQ